MRQTEAALVIDRAAIEAARLNLSYTEIRAPFAGRLGRNQAPKALWSARRSGPLNTLVAARSDLRFLQSERVRTCRNRRRRAPAVKSKPRFSWRARTSRVRKGELTFLDNVVDRSTGTIVARVTIANSDFALLPGQYVRVRLHAKG